MSPNNLTVIILCFNEAMHIKRCIENLQPIAKSIYIIDSFSNDDTSSLAESLGAKVFRRAWKNHADQFQWALDNCPIETEWVMRMDADEYLEPNLLDEIKVKLVELPTDVSGVFLKRKHHFMGRWIKHGDRYPLKLLRIWRNGHAHIENRWMDEHVVLDAGKSVMFNGDFVDDNLNTVQWFIDKHNRYASREMLDILNQKYQLFARDASIEHGDTGQAKIKRFVKEAIYNRLPIFVRPALYFIYRYFLRLGFLDGAEGFAYHFMQGFWYRCLVDLKVLEAERLISQHDTQEAKLSCLEQLTGLSLLAK